MRRHLILIAVALLTACSYSTERTGATNDPVTGLSKETRRCIEEPLLNGWSLNLADLSNDLTPEEESALDMAKDYCLNNSNSLKPPTSLDDQLQLPPQLLRAPSAFNSTLSLYTIKTMILIALVDLIQTILDKINECTLT